ncbi:7837_t:CDS:1, partial [Funneliformis geosporum]
ITYLSPEVLEEICNSRGKIKNAVTVMTKKHHISTRRIYEI